MVWDRPVFIASGNGYGPILFVASERCCVGAGELPFLDRSTVSPFSSLAAMLPSPRFWHVEPIANRKSGHGRGLSWHVVRPEVVSGERQVYEQCGTTSIGVS